VQQPEADAPLTDEEHKYLQDMMTLIRSRNPYQLTRDGVLNLPDFAPIALLGLTEEQATLRLKTEPAFRRIDIRLTRLPLKKTGAAALKHFGYDLFERAPSTFAPVTNVPVPSDYIVGPGDQLDVQLYGNQNRSLKLTVGHDGRVTLPDIGPIGVGGLLFSQAKASIEGRIERQMIGIHANVSMSDTRSIRVFVLGEASYPGSYTISGLGTITSALFAAGGVRANGSLRNVELKRRGALVRRFDLYDLLIRGDTTDDVKLLQGDVIFIPPVGATVSVDGEVQRPAIYEIRNESTVADAVRLAGGLKPEADPPGAMLTRIDGNLRRVVIRVDLSPGAPAQGLRNGDLLRVPRLPPTLDSGVLVQGRTYSGGAFAFRPGMRLTDIIRSVDELQPDADLHYLLIRREIPPDRHISVLSADLAAALADPSGKANIELMPRDRITVFDLSAGRSRIIHPVLDELRLQGDVRQPSQVVHVNGSVRIPGDYPLEPDMHVSDLVRAGGGLTEAAYGANAELTRYDVVNGQTRRTQLIQIDLAAALRGDPANNVKLAAFDTLTVKQVEEWQAQASVTLRGEVRFPGMYAVKRGETLKSVIERAGGLTEYAFPEGSVFTRDELRKREQAQMDMLAERMQRDLALLALEGAAANQAGAATALSVGQTLLSQLKSTQAVGRLVIDLPATMRSPVGSPADVIMRNGDELVVPKFQQQVMVIGEVQNATSLLYSAGLSRDNYIARSGGMTQRADSGKVYVVRANGSVVASSGSRWFGGSTVKIQPGDTIVVPLDTERIPALPFWTAVTTILYNVAIAVAAVHSF
jgi:protein involved in polysaccharide export with SLBB domain